MKKVIVDHGHNQCNCTYKLSSYDFCSLLDEIYIIFFKANNLNRIVVGYRNTDFGFILSCPNSRIETTKFLVSILLYY